MHEVLRKMKLATEKWHVWKGDAIYHTQFLPKFGKIIRQAIT